jgi:proline iminopeptidase
VITASIDDLLYPCIEPYAQGHLNVDSIHQIFWEECGNPDGVPVVFLHGGPGAGCDDTCRRYFDPSIFRIILFDQRGSGRSLPLGEIERNSPEFLLADIEALRHFAGVTRWHVFGGSWGGALALLYAGRHPERCLSLTIRSVTLFEKSDIEWWFRGMGFFFPELWAEFSSLALNSECADLFSICYEALMGSDERHRRSISMAMHAYGSGCGARPSAPVPKFNWDDQEEAMRLDAFYKVFVYFAKHHVFAPGDILQNAEQWAGIPGTIIQGRVDIISPPESSYRLHKVWPGATYQVVEDGGHSSRQPTMAHALIQATKGYARIT